MTNNEFLSKQIEKALEKKKKQKYESEWYNLRPLLGHANWAIFYVMLGSREVGKSYAVTDYFCHEYKTKGIPFIWLRLTDKAAQKLLANNSEKLVDPDLRRRYNLNLRTKGNNVYDVVEEEYTTKTGKTMKKVVSKKLFARVYAISTFYNDKGSIYDNEFLKMDPKNQYLVAIDEFEREKGEKNTFDITYSIVNQLENLLRSTKERTKVFFIGNTLESASDILCAFNFIPESWGTFKLKSKRCVIENIEPTEQYKERRRGTIADLLMPQASTFTNKQDVDDTLVDKRPLITPAYVIKFTKDKAHWYTVWNNGIIAKFKGEKKPVIAMRPYLDEVYNKDSAKNVLNLFDTRSFHYRNLITFKQFQQDIELLKPRQSG